MRHFAAVFAFFCCYFLIPASARAEAFDLRIQLNPNVQNSTHFEAAALAYTKQCVPFDKSNNWVPSACITPVEIQISVIEIYFGKSFDSFRPLTSKQFFIHSGLSPPSVFV